jgi:hypothetical protein
MKELATCQAAGAEAFWTRRYRAVRDEARLADFSVWPLW